MTYNSAIAACEKGGEWKRALNVLSQMRADGIAPGVKAYTAAIAACARASPSQTTVALGLLAQMKKQAAEGDKNAVPNVITYSAAINSCAHTGEWRRSLDLLETTAEMLPKSPYYYYIIPYVTHPSIITRIHLDEQTNIKNLIAGRSRFEP